MKNKLKLTLLFTILLFSILLIKSTYAVETKSDFSKVELSWGTNLNNQDTTTPTNFSYYPTILNVKNAVYDDDNCSYIVFVSTEEIDINTNDILSNDVSIDMKTAVSQTISSTSSSVYNVPYFLSTSLNKLYVYIYEYNITNKTCDKVYENTVSRPDELSLSQRIFAYFFSDYTSLFNYYYQLGSNKEDFIPKENVTIKIGEIKNNEILKSIKNKDASGMSNLLDYAKKDSSPLYTTTIEMTSGSYRGDALPLDGLIANKKYYYVYFDNGGSDSSYYHVEDVGLYYGCVGESVGTNLFSYYDKSFEWNLDENENGKEEPKPQILPQTGNINFIIYSIVSIVLISSAVFFYKHSKIK